MFSVLVLLNNVFWGFTLIWENMQPVTHTLSDLKSYAKGSMRRIRNDSPRQLLRDDSNSIGTGNRSDDSNSKFARMQIKIIEANELLAMDNNGLSDPYCIVKRKTSSATGEDLDLEIGRTIIVPKSLNPDWRDTTPNTFDFDIFSPDEGKVTIELWDKDIIGRDALGSVVVPIKREPYSTRIPIRHPEREGEDAGSILISVKLEIFNPSSWAIFRTIFFRPAPAKAPEDVSVDGIKTDMRFLEDNMFAPALAEFNEISSWADPKRSIIALGYFLFVVSSNLMPVIRGHSIFLAAKAAVTGRAKKRFRLSRTIADSADDEAYDAKTDLELYGPHALYYYVTARFAGLDKNSMIGGMIPLLFLSARCLFCMAMLCAGGENMDDQSNASSSSSSSSVPQVSNPQDGQADVRRPNMRSLRQWTVLQKSQIPRKQSWSTYFAEKAVNHYGKHIALNFQAFLRQMVYCVEKFWDISRFEHEKEFGMSCALVLGFIAFGLSEVFAETLGYLAFYSIFAILAYMMLPPNWRFFGALSHNVSTWIHFNAKMLESDVSLDDVLHAHTVKSPNGREEDEDSTASPASTESEAAETGTNTSSRLQPPYDPSDIVVPSDSDMPVMHPVDFTECLPGRSNPFRCIGSLFRRRRRTAQSAEIVTRVLYQNTDPASPGNGDHVNTLNADKFRPVKIQENGNRGPALFRQVSGM